MKISHNWLKNYINSEIKPEEIASILTDTGLEVEKIEKIESIKGGLKGVVIGNVLSIKKHSNADRLNIAKVEIGSDQPLNIVCGASNLKADQKVAVATVGTRLYSENDSFTIKQSKIRGELSQGMICSEKELGIGDDNEGIMILDQNAKIGLKASEFFNIESDYVYEIGLTPNRSDAMSHYGVARDLIAVLKLKDEKLSLKLPSLDDFIEKISTNNLSIEIEDYDDCPRYSGIIIENVKVKSSPKWLKNYLLSIGLTPINNIVDATNYILHDLGQPLHAFDYKKIKNEKIIVKNLPSKTKFMTLDGIERELSNKDLMICNENEAMCMAGILGGIKSGVTEKTTKIFIESAYFNPTTIRKSAKRHSLSTDASFRFERSIDPNLVVYALKKAAILIADLAEGEISSNIFDLYPKPIKNFKVDLYFKKIFSLIGEEICKDSIKKILGNLDIEITNETANKLCLSIPPYRYDVRRPADVIEEILRIYGYNNISIPKKLSSAIVNSQKIKPGYIQNIVSDFLSNNGFNECINNSISNSSYNKLIPEIIKEEEITLQNPLSQELNSMRQSLIFNGLNNINYNLNRKNKNLKLYEFGKTYNFNKNFNEDQKLIILACGQKSDENWNNSNDKIDLYWLKEYIQQILNKIGYHNLEGKKNKSSFLNNSYKFMSRKKDLVFFGNISKQLLEKFEIKEDVVYAEFNWDNILKYYTSKIKYKTISKFPHVRRDLALLIDKQIDFESIRQIAIKCENKLLKSINLFDVYEGNNLPKGKKSYAISFIIQDQFKTLNEDEIEHIMSKLVKSFKDKIGAEIRM